MAAFRWIQIFLLLILVIQFKAQTETQKTFITVRDGDEVTLSCGNRRGTHYEYDETIWFFNDKLTSETKTLVKLGNNHREMKTISDRLSVTANGFLHLHKVTEGDAGRYICRLSNSGQNHDFEVFLSVITIVEQENPDNVALFCSVLDYEGCLHEVKWLHEGNEEKPSDIEINPHSCSATVTFPTSHQKLDIYPSLTCKVTNSVTKAVQLIPFSPQSSGENQRETTKEVEKTTNSADFTSTSFPWWYIFIPLCSVMVLITVLVIIRWNKTKGNKTQIEGIQTEPEDGLSYASINFKKSKKKTGNVPETVIYSSVGTSSSSAGVSSDTVCLYSTVNMK